MSELGEMVKDVSELYDEYMEHLKIKEEMSTNGKELRVDKEDPTLPMTNKNLSAIRHCKTCGNELGSIDVDGECTKCALQRLRVLETKLAQLNKIKQEHAFCPVEGHGEVYNNKLHQDWCGKFVINGVELYPVFPVCKDCIDRLTSYLVYFLEQRGILRKGSGHIKNIYGDPYGEGLSLVEKQDAVERLKEFLRIINLYTLDSTSSVSDLHALLKERRTRILQSDQKGVREWQKEREVKLPTNQLEFLQLAEKYYPCLKNDTVEQKQRSKEIEWLKTQPIPEAVIDKVVLLIKKGIAGWGQFIQLKETEKENLDQVKLSRNYLKELLSRDTKKRSGKDVSNMMEFLNQIVSWELGPLADSAEEVVDQALQRVTLSSLILKSTTDESKPDQ